MSDDTITIGDTIYRHVPGLCFARTPNGLVFFVELDDGSLLEEPTPWQPCRHYTQRDAYARSEEEAQRRGWIWPVMSLSDLGALIT